MVRRRKAGAARESASERAMRDQEVTRANRELVAYFKGRRTEREARSALKIIKAFVRERERQDAAARPPLPGGAAAKAASEPAAKNATSVGGKRRTRKARRSAPGRPAELGAALRRGTERGRADAGVAGADAATLNQPVAVPPEKTGRDE